MNGATIFINGESLVSASPETIALYNPANGRHKLAIPAGYFVEPTLFANVDPQTKNGQGEIFGPVLSATNFKDEDGATRLANSTIYGLANQIWTSSLSTGMKLSEAIKAGMISIFTSPPMGETSGGLSVESYGQSGVGLECKLAGLETYLRRQVMSSNYE